jgi:arsenite methyltransferase
MTDTIRDEVRRHYARAALTVLGPGDCCGPTAAMPAEDAPGADAPGAGVPAVGDPVFGPGLYDPAQIAELPADAVAASLGCGNPTAMADLRAGETVLDLGSGGGIDVLLSARRVGPTGLAYGLDMTDEMLELARRNAAAAQVENARFLKGEIEAIPLPDASVDVVISNCVINLSTDKGRVFAEIARVLRPDGRMSVSDVVADDELTPADRASRGDHAGCIAGALSFTEYAEGLAAAGLDRVELQPTHRGVDGMFNVIIRARRPATPGDDAAAPGGATAPVGGALAPGDATSAAGLETAAAVAARALAAARALPHDGSVVLAADATDAADACGAACCCG